MRRWRARTETLTRRRTRASAQVAARWEQFIEYLALGLTQDLGEEVVPLWPKKLDPAARLDAGIRALVDDGKLTAAIRVPGAIAAIELEADLRTRLFTTAVEVTGPREGRSKTRISWLLRQLKDAPNTTRVRVRYPNAKDTVSAILKDVRDKPEKLLLPSDLKRDPKLFRIAQAKELGAKRGRGAGSFVLESKNQTSEFYRTTVQQLRAWSGSAPRLPVSGEPSDEATPEPPPFSSPAERTFGDASLPEG